MKEELIFTILIDGVPKTNIKGIQQSEKHATKLSNVFKNKIVDVIIDNTLYSSFFNGEEISDEEREYFKNKGFYRNDCLTIEDENEKIEIYFLKNKEQAENILSDILKNSDRGIF
jgi:hypothetical protein